MGVLESSFFFFCPRCRVDESMIPITFTKATGAGNDFVIIDEFASPLGQDPALLARALCDRHFGIGADGLLLLRPHGGEDFEMRYYNADGSTGGMCGNGGRCAARYAHERDLAGASMRFVALDYVYRAEVTERGVRLSMKDPRLVSSEKDLRVGGKTFRGHLFDTGSPHMVIFSSPLEDLDVVSSGRALRHHPDLAPEGANINFAAIDQDGVVNLRTYERGVENETLACGTGSVASATAAVLFRGLASPVTVRVRSGESMTVFLTRAGESAHSVVLAGSARLLFTGSCQFDPVAGIIVARSL